MRKRKGPPAWQDPVAILEHEVPKDSRERAEDTSRKAVCEALRNMKQVVGRAQLEGPPSEALSHVYRTIQEEDDSLGYSLEVFDDLCQHVVKTCPFFRDSKNLV